MEVIPVDLVGLAAVIMGISVVLVPVIGLTARYALKPIVGVIARSLETRGTEESVQIVERRLELLEQQLEDVQGSLSRLVEVSEFDARLRAGGAGALPGAQDAGPADAESEGP